MLLGRAGENAQPSGSISPLRRNFCCRIHRHFFIFSQLYRYYLAFIHSYNR